MTILIGEIKSINELHHLFKGRLQFPDFYGMNWDAFGDAITGLVTMPDELVLAGFSKFKEQFPGDALILEDIAKEYNSLNREKIVLL